MYVRAFIVLCMYVCTCLHSTVYVHRGNVFRFKSMHDSALGSGSKNTKFPELLDPVS